LLFILPPLVRLTDFQKQIVRDIAEGKITTVESFLEVTYKPKSVPMPPKNTIEFVYGDRIKRYIDAGTAGWIFDDIDKAREGLKVFVPLWERLAGAGLVATVYTENRTNTFTPVFKTVPTQNSMDIHRDVMTIIQEHASTVLQKLPDLDYFVANGFLTDDELEKQRANEAAKRAQRTTNILAVTTIILGIITAVGTTWFNWKTYTTERSVIITNTNAFSDTQRVLIVNPSAVPVTNIVVITFGSNGTASVQPAK